MPKAVRKAAIRNSRSNQIIDCGRFFGMTGSNSSILVMLNLFQHPERPAIFVTPLPLWFPIKSGMTIFKPAQNPNRYPPPVPIVSNAPPK